MAGTRALILSALLGVVLHFAHSQGIDNTPPIFAQPQYFVVVDEDHTPGTPINSGNPVTASDLDDDYVRYFIPSNSLNSDRFEVRTENISGGTQGVVYLRNGSDLLNLGQMTLLLFVQATDDVEHGGQAAETVVNVIINDINNNSPDLENLDGAVEHSENTNIGVEIFDVDAIDADHGANAILLYFIDTVQSDLGTNTTGLFDININNGKITLQRSLDYDEDGREYTIGITVQDRGDGPLENMGTLTVNVRDENDLPPFFDPPQYAATIHENVTYGEVVAQVRAFDGDRGVDDDILYEIISGNLEINGTPSFIIGRETGVISVNNISSLDRETHSQYTLTVQATELNDITMDEQVDVQITIVDVNDNTPTFDQAAYSGNISELADIGDPVLDITARDRDEGIHGQFIFIVESVENASLPVPFRVDHVEGEGELVVDGELDYETVTSYNLRILAVEVINNEPKTGTAMVTVSVINQNDNSPVFRNNTYFASISENVQATFLIRVIADDNDLGVFGDVLYNLESGHMNMFAVDSESGEVNTTQPLNYEVRQQYVITIKATDQGGGVQRTDFATLTVDIINRNDEPPEFIRDGVSVATVEVNATEGQSSGITVIRLEARDGDGDLNPLTYSLLSEGNELGNFKLDDNDPTLVVTTDSLDFDLGVEVYTLKVTVNDSVHEDLLEVVVSVQDINDNFPNFIISSYEFFVEENLNASAFVGQVQAIDIDSGLFGMVTYRLSGVGAERFSINETSGEIITEVLLNREEVGEYNLVVTATDLDPSEVDRKEMPVPVIIIVEDVNDNTPRFDSPVAQHDIIENTNLVMIPVPATDPDAGDNGRITYEIIGGNINDTFAIADPSVGVISRNTLSQLERIDRETVSEYELIVKATDGGNPARNSTARVLIEILDQNDFSPQFEIEYMRSIREDLAVGEAVIELEAVDRDAGSNAVLTYSITFQSSGENFALAPNTGIVTTLRRFDREIFEGPYTILILAEDGGVPSNNGSTTLIVNLLDVNDKIPRFLAASYGPVDVPEEEATGRFVVQVAATDDDEPSTNNTLLTYSIAEVIVRSQNEAIPLPEGLDATYHFSINSTHGQIYTNVSLDREAIQSYVIEVTATDMGPSPGLSSSVLVTVDVMDINDNPPEFTQDVYTFNISEGTSVNTRFTSPRILATDRDDGLNAMILYSINTSNVPFELDPNFGDLILTAPLSYSDQNMYTISILASGSGTIPRTDEATVLVYVEDINDNGPIFTPSIVTASVREGNYTAQSFNVVNVTATDEDTAQFGRVTYSITSDNVNGLFDVENTTGRVLVTGNVDRESTTSYSFIVTAEDGGDPPRQATARVTVTVVDVNDNAPEFVRDRYVDFIDEEIPMGTVTNILRVSASDIDQGENAVITYEVSGTTFFQIIDPTSGWISTATQFNYEMADQREFNFTVIARDNATVDPTMETPVPVTIYVIDINDNPPMFDPLPNPLTVDEDSELGNLVCCITAVDADSGSNAEIQYQLSGDEGKFQLLSNGTLALVSSLDFETTQSYNITITATDGGQPARMDVAFFQVTVGDVNDDVPEFDQEMYFVSVPEDTDSTTLLTMVITDRDSGLGGTIFCTLSGDGSNTVFRVDRRSSGPDQYECSLIRMRELDFEETMSYSLTVEANDFISPPHSDTANISITVRDTNDNSPVFSMPAGYVFQVDESSPVESAVGTVVATDDDGGSAGTLRYYFAEGTESRVMLDLALNNTTGVITVIQELNFESLDEYTFTVFAQDVSSSPLNTSVAVRVEVLDTNEDAPVFQNRPYEATVQEGAGVPDDVFRVNATDSESSGTAGLITYSITDGARGMFSIDGTTGRISKLGELDRENVSVYVLTVQAEDTGNVAFTSFAQVTVAVSDINDNNPTFGLDAYEYTNLAEGSRGGETLSPVLTATDRDEGSNADITYSLIGATNFTVDPDTGVISVVNGAILDRETTPVHTFKLKAEDKGTAPRDRIIDITVVLADANDNDPVFGQPDGYSMGINENSPDGVSVVTITATDSDGDAVTYAIESGDDFPLSKFTINPSTGLIQTTSNSLDRETKDSYVLVVSATDDGTPSNTATVQVTLTVNDVNDNMPIFSSAQYSFTRPEANDEVIVITQLEAPDRDAGSNAVVRFRFAPGSNLGGIFSINNQGELIAAEDGLDYETEEVHILRVIAEDQATTNRMSSTATVTVNLLDVNDNNPEFSEEVYTGQVFEYVDPGEEVLVVMATDADNDTNIRLIFTFQDPSNPFAISSEDGRTATITVSDQLNAELVPSYMLVVQASDGARVDTATVLIDILSINDKNPRFEKSFYRAEVSEDDAMDTSAITVRATDPDGSPVTYSITAGDDDRLFKIDRSTGEILTANTLDREQTALFELTVTASDDGLSQNGTVTVQTGTTMVQIAVQDINDESPQFTADEYTASLVENSPQGTQIQPVNMTGVPMRIEAVDADEANTQNSRVLYSLQGVNSDLFDIDFDTGIVTVARGTELNREETPEITVTVVARDSVPAPLTRSSTALLRITLEDVNDVAPLFGQPFGYAIAIQEDTDVNAVIRTITATDPDLGTSGEVTFAITSATPIDALQSFDITTSNTSDSGTVTYSGVISLARELDREDEDIITIRVTATDNGVPVLSSLVTVQVTVTDVNDNEPIFGEDIYTTTVSEFLPVGASAFQVIATDPDISRNAEVHYSVLESSGGVFTVNPDTGIITTTTALDHETQQSHTILIEACDRGVPQLCANTTVILNIEDSNDEVPTFDFTPYRVDICEDYITMTTIVQPVATDADSGINAEILYSLQGGPTGLFDINQESGQIYLRRNLVDSDIGALHSLTVVATDGGSPTQTGEAEVIVRVFNCTLQTHRFNTSYFQFSLQENSDNLDAVLDILPTPSAVGLAFTPPYDNNPFFLATVGTGPGLEHVLLLEQDAELVRLGLQSTGGTGIDRERRSVFTVIVAAAPSVGKRQASDVMTYSSATITVLDEEDNRPVFDADFYRFSVREGEETTIGTVSATDSDSGAFGRVEYSLLTVTPTSSQFEINSTTGEIRTASALDREAVQLYRMSIRAVDSALSGPTTTVEVIVLDINDVKPNFTLPEYVAQVAENVPSGTSVVTVEAEDTDSGANGVVRYSIVSGDVGVLDLDPISGVVTTVTELDFESETSYMLQVRASDEGSPSLSMDVNVVIEVQDFNDCPPEFINPPTSRSILENATIGSVLYTFEVTDCDSGINGINGTRFSIIAGNRHDLFVIGSESGVLRTVGVLDRERQDGSAYDLQIQARDQEGVGGEALTSVTQLRVSISDVNDHTPVFVETVFTTSVSEGEDLDETILEVPATDLDSGTNGQIIYSLEDDFGVFQIDVGTGDLQLSNTLDREAQDSYVLTVIARDRGAEPRSNTTRVEITVEDENDNTPEITNIESGVTCVEVSEGAIDGHIFTANATDLDSGLNGMVLFFLETADASLPFSITTAGVISKQGDLDYEMQSEYTLVVRAVDQGVRPLTGIATLCVRVQDENDNDPMCAEDSYIRDQPENTAPTSVVVVTGIDADQTDTDNAFISYSLRGDPEALATFVIDNVTGVISNVVELDRELHPSPYNLTVELANSRSHNVRRGECLVVVNVVDVNDEIPQFGQASYEESLPELSAVGMSVLDVTATDGDQPGHPNSQLAFSLARLDNNPFTIDPNSGTLFIQNSLDYEATSQYELTVRVEDKGVPLRANETTITIQLEDENDEPPQFIFPAGQTTYTASVSELAVINSTHPRSLSTVVEYDDADGPENRNSTVAKVRVLDSDGMEVTDGRQNLFSVVSDPSTKTASILLSGMLDREEADLYRVELTVENDRDGVGARCGGQPTCRLSNTAFMEVTVEDENDNRPVFERTAYSAEVSTTADQGTSVLTVRATDPDSGVSGSVRYEIVGGDGRFRVDLETGTIFTRSSLEDLNGVTIQLTVRAFDSLDSTLAVSQSTEVPVTLLVLDDFQRIRIVFDCDVNTVIGQEDVIQQTIEDLSGLDVIVESIVPGDDDCTNFTFHANDPGNKEIIDYYEFVDRTDQDALIQLLTDQVCRVKRIEPVAGPARYLDDLSTPTIVIIVLCALLSAGAAVLLFLAFRQRWIAVHKARSKLLANVFYGTPPSVSMIENMAQQDFELRALERGQHHNKDNPMFVDPYYNWTGIDTSGADSVGDESLRDNPLYEEQEIRMEMFASDSEDEDEEDVGNEAELLAAALQDDEKESDDEEELPTVTAI